MLACEGASTVRAPHLKIVADRLLKLPLVEAARREVELLLRAAGMHIHSARVSRKARADMPTCRDAVCVHRK
jgi:hypothetical protein